MLRPAGRTESGTFWSGEEEEKVIDLLVALVTPERTFVDIGANVGLVGLRVAMRARPHTTIFIEPIPSNVALLGESIRRTGIGEACTVLPFALGDHHGAAELYLEGDWRRTGNAGPLPRPGTMKVAVPLRPLDALITDQVDVIKIDVEGQEPAVIAGAMQTISRSLPVIFGEFQDVIPGHPRNLAAVMGLLRPLGYRSCMFVSPRHLVEFIPFPGKGNALLVPPRFDPPDGWRFDWLA